MGLLRHYYIGFDALIFGSKEDDFEIAHIVYLTAYGKTRDTGEDHSHVDTSSLTAQLQLSIRNVVLVTACYRGLSWMTAFLDACENLGKMDSTGT